MSTGGLPDIDFARIRPYGQPASRAGGFEELASILIKQGVVEWPDGVRFERFGAPDGGREGRGTLPGGDVWAWQVKYLFEFDASAVSQITHSVERSLETERRLKRYFVAIPIDLPAGDTKPGPKGGKKTKSAQTRWEESVQKWGEAARSKGMDVEFVLVNAHMLVTALTESRHAGRAWYWFGASILSKQWQTERLDDVIAKAGPRYTPQLHIEVDAARAIDAIGRTGTWVRGWQQALADLRGTRRWEWRAPELDKDAFTDPLPRCASALGEADAALAGMIAAAGTPGKLPDVEGPLSTAQSSLLEIDQLLHQHATTPDGHLVGDAASLYGDACKAAAAIGDALGLARSAHTRAAAEKVLLLTGGPGTGKTHLLCDAARRRTEAGLPTVLLLGQDFDGRSLPGQLGELTQLGKTPDDVLSVLDAAAEACGHIGLLMIDALNESERSGRWRSDLLALVTACRRHPHVALVVSCRSEFVEDVVGDEKLPTIEHVGFAEATDIAVMRFTQEYGLEPPTFPPLNPEFENPLYLKLTCEALQTLGATRFQFGIAGLTTVTSAFIEAVNQRLSEPDRCNYDKTNNLVDASVRQLAELGTGPWERADVTRITEGLLPGREWSRSLMRGLLAEGILIEQYKANIAFGYQRLGDVASAAVIAAREPDDIQQWVKDVGEQEWSQRGVLSALAVILPERHRKEIIDLAADQGGSVSEPVIDGFIDSMLLRSPESVTARAVTLVERLLAIDYRVGDIRECLVRIACVPGHSLNAKWLHSYLAALTLADRDTTWSTWLAGALEEDHGISGIRRLIDWAWPTGPASQPAVPDDVAELAVQLLGWLLTTSDRQVRDQATKAIVSVGERAPAAFAKALTQFQGVNDPYVTERLAAAACGVVLRNNDPHASALVAGSLETLLADWPLHLLTRDYARRVFAAAGARGWPGTQWHPPYGAQWPVKARSLDEIEQLAAPPGYAYSSVWHSLSGMGDFGRYVLQQSLSDIESPDPQALLHVAERVIFDRVLDLGWTPERFRSIDNRRGWRDDSPVERIGKKYQWIGLYEVLGRVTDNFKLSPSWDDSSPHPYQFPEQLVYRDIDPTVLARRPASASPERPWFSPAGARFPEEITMEYPNDMAAVPDPLDLITLRDPQGADWLTLAGRADWQQQIPPETEALGVPRREAWMHVTAYIVPISTARALKDWAPGRDWSGRRMPEVPNVNNVLLGSYLDAPQWAEADGSIPYWDETRCGQMPEGLAFAVAQYGGVGSRDRSADAETTGWVPSRRLYDALGLAHGVDLSWYDASGTVAVRDPSAINHGPSTLVMRRDLLPCITAAGLTLFWTAAISSELHSTDPFFHPGSDYRWVGGSASYLLEDSTITLISATAARYKPGPESEHSVKWAPRQSDQ